MINALLLSSAYGWFVGLLVMMVVMAVLFVLIAIFALKPIRVDGKQNENDLAQKLLEKYQAELTLKLLNNKEDKAAAEEIEEKLRQATAAEKLVNELIAEELGVSADVKRYGVDSELTEAEAERLEKDDRVSIEQTFDAAQPVQGDDGVKKSFTAMLMQASDEVKVWYFELKNCILCYEKTKNRMLWSNEKFYVGRNNAATLTMRGKTLCLYLAVNADDYSGEFPVKASTSDKYKEATPCLFRIKNEKNVKQAKELISLMMSDYGVLYVKTNHSIYALPYQDDDALVARGLAKKE